MRGSAAAVGKAFRTRLLAVRLADGTAGRFATSAPAVPAAIASSVTAVIGLDNLGRPESFAATAHLAGDAAAGTGGATRSARAPARSAASAAAAAAAGPHVCQRAAQFAPIFSAYTPDQIARAYGFDGLYASGNLGAGQTVAIFELEPFSLSDVAAFDECFFGRSHTSAITVLPIDGGQLPGPGSGEAALDVEEVSALAPAAHLDVYVAPQTFTSWIDEIAAIVSQDRASVVSTSWGVCEAQLTADSPGFQQIENVLFQQAALEGQSWFAASGDSGSEGCSRNDPADNSLSVSDPASQPYVTGVGGTTLLAPTDPPTEVVWNDGGIAGEGSDGGSGGGLSSLWQMPSWQSALHVPGVKNGYSSGTPCGAAAGVECREIPDVSANADELHGDLVYYQGQWTSIGGTSAAAPKWAAVAALADATCASEHVTRIGFANPALYQIASSPATYAEAFNDVKVGDNDVVAQHHGAYPATKGYDLATGLGTPRVTSPSGGKGLAALLCADGAALATRPVLAAVSPDFGRYQGGTTVAIHGTDLSGVTAVNFGSSVVPVTPADVNGAGTKITVVTPASPLNPNVPGAPVGGVVVTVSGLGGSSEPSPLAEFHFVAESSSNPLPSVSYVGPSAGPSKGGETVTIIGSGFEEGLSGGSKATVKFGGVIVPASAVTVRSDAELAVVVPAQSGATDCVTAPAVPTSNICQVEVTVSNGNGASTTLPILPAPTGSTEEAQPPDTELVAAATEFDYAPLPTTTSISPKQLPQEINPFASSVPTVTIDGSGFNFLTLVGVTFGPPTASYATPGFGLAEIEPHQLQVFYFGLVRPARAPTMPVTVQTAGGSSNAQTVVFATGPILLSIDVHQGPTTGGTRVSATGIGFSSGDNVEFAANGPFGVTGLSGTQDVQVRNGQNLTFVTPAAPSGHGVFEVCNAAGCSPLTGASVSFTYYEPVRPVVEHISPTSGPAGGGGFVAISGTGLGTVESVSFGAARSPLVTNPQTAVGTSDTEVVAAIPPGNVGASVRIKVTTEVGTASGPRFRYKRSVPAAPGRVEARAAGGSIAVSWKASASDGGSPLTGYVVSAIPKVGLGLTVDVAPSTHHVLLAPLAPGFVYRVAVSAENALGRSTKAARPVVPTLGDNGYVVAGSGGAVAGFGSLAGAPSGLAGGRCRRRSSAWQPPRTLRATGLREQTAASTRSAPPSSSVRWPATICEHPSSASSRRPTEAGTGSWARRAASPGSGPPVSSGRFRPGS